MNPYDFFSKIYLINLKTRPDRLAQAEQELKRACIWDRVEVIEAIEDKENPSRGNHLSHALCLRKAKEERATNALIFEDDIEWLNDPLLFKRVVPEIPEWDLLYLGVNTEKPCLQITRHLARLTFAYSTHAYAVNHTLFDRLIALNESPDTIHNDVRITEEIIPTYNCFVTLPLLAGQRRDYSDIQKTVMDSNPVFLSRLENNLVRKDFPVLEPTFVTFVTPSIGRPTLGRAVQSVIDQIDWNWKMIVVLDGWNTDYTTDNDHVSMVKINRLSHAGLVRNEGLKRVTTDWVAFLDDDDYVDRNYVDTLRHYTENNDVVIFTYKDVKTGNVQPPQNNDPEFHECHVGISFAVRTDFLIRNNISFDPYAIEDYRFLDRCRKAGARYIVTHKIMYYVGGIGGWTR